jgi:hypothetical protein
MAHEGIACSTKHLHCLMKRVNHWCLQSRFTRSTESEDSLPILQRTWSDTHQAKIAETRPASQLNLSINQLTLQKNTHFYVLIVILQKDAKPQQ